jgi:hypothetical protein
MKGYKAFDSSLKCRGFQYEIGKMYEIDGPLVLCLHGFHFCKEIASVYKYYSKSDTIRICEVAALGEIKTDDGIKYCTDRIKIVREITEDWIRRGNQDNTSIGFCNVGQYNTGNSNVGYRNTGVMNWGYYNVGNGNLGHNNTGNRNLGNYNTGSYNEGYCNTGDYNKGNGNTGFHNLGSRNSGDWNLGDYNSGCFNVLDQHKIYMFDKPSDWSYLDWFYSSACKIMGECPSLKGNWVSTDEMDEKEIEDHPYYKTTGGYLKFDYNDSKRQNWWDNLTRDERDTVMSLPNFDAEIFYKCTGIKV